MGNLGVFGWLGLALLAASLCVQGVRWIREDAVADLRREIGAETARIQHAASIGAAENAAQSEHEALAAEKVEAERERRLEELTYEIAELEGKNTKCGTISRATARSLNALRLHCCLPAAPPSSSWSR